VQVHPDDAQTLAAGLGRQGKEECWLVIAAEEDARLGIGFDAPISAEAMRRRAGWQHRGATGVAQVAPGDFFYIPAGTVHAIGAGVSDGGSAEQRHHLSPVRLWPPA
jgi:mannose-6-phosphate isomerase